MIILRAYDIILKKRNQEKLSEEEIKFLVQGYTSGQIPDYQIASWAMAVYFSGLDDEETSWLTKWMVNSGEIFNLDAISGIKVDKHSTGGVGDKTTLILVPLLAAAGVKVAKMSGRGLGHTGGTIDKLEAIPGFQVEMGKKDFIRIVQKIGCAVVGQTGNLVPADKKLYALRDVTATVDSIPLIASSVMSKKIAAGADKILLDVKVGNGAFMKNKSDAFKLAELMVSIGQKLNKDTMAILSSMEEPLGFTIGNALEVQEAILTLKNSGPLDLKRLCLELGARTLVMAKKVENISQGISLLEKTLKTGLALEKFREMIKEQNGNSNVVDDISLLPQAPVQLPVQSAQNGYIYSIDTEKLGLVAMSLGAGREKKEDKIDPSVGIYLHKKIGDEVNVGENLATIYAKNEESAFQAVQQIKASFHVSRINKEKPKLILGQVTQNGAEYF